MNYIDITSPDINNGLGCRVTLWVSGCSHKCPGCHNPETWDYNYGKPFDKNAYEDIIDKLDKPYIKGLTLSGGDPLSRNINDLYLIKDLVKRVKEEYPDKDIWIYSGDTYDKLIELEVRKDILSYCDVLVDGPYIQEQRDISLPFRGSKNQRIIDLHKTVGKKIIELNIPEY